MQPVVAPRRMKYVPPERDLLYRLCRRNGEIFYASLCVYADVVITIVGNECDPRQTNVQHGVCSGSMFMVKIT
jgi:hypothetical protein